VSEYPFVEAEATIPTGDAILVSDTSTASHPSANFSTMATICWNTDGAG
jgi:hypothetical protein